MIEPAPPSGVRDNPYVGPRAFEYGERIYGRNREVLNLFDLLIAERITLLYSPSGAGKTSLIQAGLISRLEAEGFQVLLVSRINLEHPSTVDSLDVPNRYLLSALLSLEERLPRDQQLPLRELVKVDLGNYLHRRSQDGDGVDNQVVIFDQFEELLTHDPTDRAAKAAFMAQVGSALRDRRRWALFAIREDWLGGLNPYIHWLPTRLSTTFRLDFLEVAAALSAVQLPALDARVSFSEGAADKLVNDLRRVRVQRLDGIAEEPGPYVEPVQLQVVCRRLWDRLPTGTAEIDESHVEAVGDVDTALADYYAERVTSIAVQTSTSERVIRDWFDRQLITEQGFRAQVLHGPADGAANIIPLLEDAHLVRSEQRRGATWFELAHDRLVEPIRASNTAWRESTVSALQRQAALWEREGRSDGLLLRADALAEAERWAANNTSQLSSTDTDFLGACRAMALKEGAESAAAARRLRWLAAGLALFLIISIISATVALQQSRRAQREERLARSRQLAALAEAIPANQPTIAWLLSIEASRVAPTVEARGALLSALQRSPELVASLDNHAEARSLAFSPDGQMIAVGTEDPQTLKGTILFWDVTHRQLEGQVYSNYHRVLSLAFSPDGRILASGNREGTIELWDVKQRRLTSPLLNGHDDAVLSLDFSPDGQILASGTRGGSIILWNVALKRLTGRLLGHEEAVRSVAFNPSGDQLASGGRDTTVRIWDVKRQKRLGKPLTGHRETVTSVTFSRNGLLASGSGDNTVIIWDVRSGHPVGRPLTGHSDTVLSVAFSPDSKTLASGGNDGSIMLWSVADRHRIGPPLVGHTNGVACVAFSPDGTVLASGSDDDTVNLWDVQHRRWFGEYSGNARKAISGVAFSPDGRVLASGNADKTITLSSLARRQPLGVLAGHSDTVTGVAFSPDGRVLASGSADKRVVLWDVARRQPLGVLAGHSDTVTGVAFSPDGRELASGSADKTVISWDLQLNVWQHLACTFAKRNLSRTEKDQYLGSNQPYRPTCPRLPIPQR